MEKSPKNCSLHMVGLFYSKILSSYLSTEVICSSQKCHVAEELESLDEHNTNLE